MARMVAALAFALLASACATAPGAAPQPRSASMPVHGDASGSATIASNAEQSILGRGARDLLARFGDARIDLAEGDARKLQFASARCVLDIFLYPSARSDAPVATHVEARDRQGGGQTDRSGCIGDVEIAARGD